MYTLEQLRKLIRNYEVEIRYFDPDEDYWNDASVMYTERRVLEENKHLLSQEDLKKLRDLDLKVVALYEKYKDINTNTVKDWLKDIAQIAKSNLEE